MSRECDRMQYCTDNHDIDERAFKRRRVGEAGDGQEEAIPSPAHTIQGWAGQYGHRYGDISIYSNASVRIGDTIIQNDIKEVENIMKNAQAQQLAASVRQWLRAPDATVDYNTACAKRHVGTGQWLVQSPAFTRWLRQANSFLWLYGFAGCGKSVLCSTAIQHAFHHAGQQAGSAVAFFFFTFNDESKQDTSALLRALLLQLSGQVIGLHADLTRLKETYNHSTPPVPILTEYLRQAANRCRHVYLLLDALDESPAETTRADVLLIINTIRGWQLPGLHLLVTSRDILDIKEGLNAEDHNMVALRNNDIDQDILRYVSYLVEHDRQLKRWGSDFCETIKQHLAQRANGVFRWVECQLQPLRQCPKSKYDLKECLKQLPRSLDETYERMLEGIAQSCRERAQRILTLLCLSSRPLTVPEVIDAIAIDIQEAERYDPDRKLENADDLLRICPGLIDITVHLLDENNTFLAIDRGNGSTTPTEIVRIAHFSVQEYLLSPRIKLGSAAGFAISETTGHFQIAKTCLIYLCNQNFLNQALTPNLIEEYPLAGFAAEFWHHHYRLTGISSATELEVWGLALLQTRARLERWIRLYNVDRPWDTEICYDEKTQLYATPIYYASLLGLDCVLAHILSISAADINAQGGEYRNALQAASNRGHEKIVKMLLDKGADVNAQGGTLGNALQAASYRGHEKVVQILLDKGADVNIQGGRLGNALQAASEGGYEKIVKILLDKGADVNAQGERLNDALQAALVGCREMIVRILLDEGSGVNAQGGTLGNALQAASYRGHEKVVQILLDKGADVNAQGGALGNALRAASYRGHEKIVQMLLDKGADVGAQGGVLSNALQAASYRGHEKVVQILLDEGAEVNAQGGRLGNALQAASNGGYEKIVQTLLDKGADVNAQGGRLGNALQAASYRGHEKVVQMLLDKGADVNAQGGRLGNALQAASCRGYKKIVQTLLDRGADVNPQGGGRLGNALQAASEGGYEKIVQILLDKGADVNAQGGRLGNALQAASYRGHKKVVQILLDKGADVNAQGGLGNALQVASYRGHKEVVQMLLDKGANVNAQGGAFGNALQAASNGGYEKIVQTLLDKGADVDAPGGRLGNALQAASYRGHEKVVQMLLDKGADVNAQGGFFGNTLHVASEDGHEKIVQMLLDKGADVNAQGGRCGNALQAASYRGHQNMVQMLLDKGADVNAQGGKYGNALQAALEGGYERIVQMLLDKGADVNAQGGCLGNAP